jgi:hypothetical protein
MYVEHLLCIQLKRNIIFVGDHWINLMIAHVSMLLRKIIWSNAHCNFLNFSSPSCSLVTWLLKYKYMCVSLNSIFITAGVTLGLWHWGETVDLAWEQCWSVLTLLWLKVIGYWRKLHNVYSLLTPWCRVLLEKLPGLQLVKKFAAFYGTRRFTTSFTSARHLSLTWAR